MQFALLDIVVLVVVFLSAMLAMVRGFSREILSVGSWMAAAAAALAVALVDDPLTPIVRNYVENETIAMIVTIAIVFIVTLVVVSFITMRVSDFIIDSSIGALDRTLGFIFGAARGVLLFVVAVGMFNWLAPEAQPTWISEAKSKPFLDNMANSLIAVLPEDIEDLVDIGKDIVSNEDGSAPSETDDKNAPSISQSEQKALENLIPDSTNN